MGGHGQGGMVGGVIVGEDGPVLCEDVKEMNSADFYSPGQVMVGCGYTLQGLSKDELVIETVYNTLAKTYRQNRCPHGIPCSEVPLYYMY